MSNDWAASRFADILPVHVLVTTAEAPQDPEISGSSTTTNYPCEDRIETCWKFETVQLFYYGKLLKLY